MHISEFNWDISPNHAARSSWLAGICQIGHAHIVALRAFPPLDCILFRESLDLRAPSLLPFLLFQSLRVASALSRSGVGTESGPTRGENDIGQTLYYSRRARTAR
jgi:hypothetical protein